MFQYKIFLNQSYGHKKKPIYTKFGPEKHINKHLFYQIY